jgi:hypothetical protein
MNSIPSLRIPKEFNATTYFIDRYIAEDREQSHESSVLTPGFPTASFSNP